MTGCGWCDKLKTGFYQLKGREKMRKCAKRLLSVLLVALLLIMSVSSGPLPAEVFASPATQSGSIYVVSAEDTADTVAAVINGTAHNSLDAAYDGIRFTEPATYNMASGLDPGRSFSIETDAAVTFGGNGFLFTEADNDTTLSFSGSAPLTISNVDYAICAAVQGGSSDITAKRSNAAIELDGAALNITDVSECGILTGGDITLVENATLDVTYASECGIMTGGNITIAGGSHVSTSHVSECGIMTGGDITLVGSGSTLDISGTEKYGLRLASAAVNVDVQEGAVLTIKDASGYGIGADYTNSYVSVFRGGKCVVSTTGASGIRNGTVDVSGGGILEVSAPKGAALDGVSLNAGGTSLITADGGTSDTSGGTSVITGVSVLLRSAESVVDGQLVSAAGGGKVDPVPVNNAGESLTRFDLSGHAGAQISVAGGNATPGYTYEIGSDHDGTAYVWAPAVHIRFYGSQADCPPSAADEGTAGLLATDFTIRGDTIVSVGGSAPEAPDIAGQVFIGWINKATGKIADLSKDTFSSDADLYPCYAAKEKLSLPIDLYVDDGTGSSTINFVNGPRYASVEKAVAYETAFDFSALKARAESFGDTGTCLTGSFTFTMAGSAGVVPAEGFVYSSDIADYFAGGGIELFDLISPPSYDPSTNTTTFQLKVRDAYASGSYTGTDIADCLRDGFTYVVRGYNFATASALEADGYARMKNKLSGTLTIWNRDAADGNSYQLAGVQAEPDSAAPVKADPTLGTYGTDDPAETVSATILNRTPVTLDTSLTAILNAAVTGTGFTPATFEFSITPGAAKYADGGDGTSPVPSGLKGTAAFAKAGTQTVSFGSVTFDQPGTYIYKIRQNTASGSGWTCDTSEKSVTVTVTDSGKGKLAAAVTEAPTIADSYAASPDTSSTTSSTGTSSTTSSTDTSSTTSSTDTSSTTSSTDTSSTTSSTDTSSTTGSTDTSSTTSSTDTSSTTSSTAVSSTTSSSKSASSNVSNSSASTGSSKASYSARSSVSAGTSKSSVSTSAQKSASSSGTTAVTAKSDTAGPDTGDSSAAAFCIYLLLIAASCTTVILVLNRKRSAEDHKD